MQYLDYIKKNNPVIFQIFKNAYYRNKLSHAYLFSGAKGTKIDNEALFLVQILISPKPFTNVLHDVTNYIDFEVIDSEKVIKKEAITSAISRLQDKALEQGGKKILLIKNLEKANLYSLNSLLKFLEEPTPNTHLIFTTNNLASILNTIKSRTQIINVKNPSQSQVVANFINAGINQQNAKLLADFTSDVNLAKQWNAQDLVIYKSKFLLALKEAPANSEKIYTQLFEIIQPATALLMINLLNSFFNDIWRQKNGLYTAFNNAKIIDKYLDINFDYKEALLEINEFQKAIRLNVNFDLYKSKFLLQLKGLYG